MSLEIGGRLAQVRERIEAARDRADAEVDRSVDPRLIAVSKRHPVEAIEAALAAGQHDFGENYAQEFRDKRKYFEGREINWHFIGQLQRNKAKYVLGHALIHTGDRAELLQALDDRSARMQGESPDLPLDVPLLLEVNSGEAQKGGVDPGELPALLDLVAQSRHLRCVGLMTMAPAGPAEDARPHFRALRQLRNAVSLTARPRVDLRELSMGMSSDFEVAVEEGATLVRVGSAIFGPRAR
jgi:pyridoxal phosphate enzyme (YggS family)